jgi:hypothetical protein
MKIAGKARGGSGTTSLSNGSGKVSNTRDIYLKAYGSMAEVKIGLTRLLVLQPEAVAAEP